MAQEGEIYFFSKDCPVGIADHPHILVRNKGTYLFLNTCSSKLETAIRLATLRGWDTRTFPMFKPDATNMLTRDTYVNCNSFVELTAQRFGELMSGGFISREAGEGVMTGAQLVEIRQGIELSVNISDEDKDRILR